MKDLTDDQLDRVIERHDGSFEIDDAMWLSMVAFARSAIAADRALNAADKPAGEQAEPDAPSGAVELTTHDEDAAVEFYRLNPSAALFDLRKRIDRPLAAPATAAAEPDALLDAFEHWLNERRDLSVAEAFHDIVNEFNRLRTTLDEALTISLKCPKDHHWGPGPDPRPECSEVTKLRAAVTDKRAAPTWEQLRELASKHGAWIDGYGPFAAELLATYGAAPEHQPHWVEPWLAARKEQADKAAGVQAAPQVVQLPALPAVCDGKEQDAFETWARSERMDMSQHPLHWLFLDARTDAARQGWKGGLTYAVMAVGAALAAPTVCRTDGRCQYAIDSGAEGMGHCPTGKCVMPPPAGANDEVPEADMCAAQVPAEPEWSDPRVQAVYEILCSDNAPPDGEHWEGFAAKRIVQALSVKPVGVSHADVQREALISEELQRRNWPSNPRNAARAGWYAAIRAQGLPPPAGANDEIDRWLQTR